MSIIAALIIPVLIIPPCNSYSHGPLNGTSRIATMFAACTISAWTKGRDHSRVRNRVDELPHFSVEGLARDSQEAAIWKPRAFAIFLLRIAFSITFTH